MKRVIGLIKKEHLYLKKTNIVLLVSSIFMIGILPFPIHYYADSIAINDIRPVLLFLSVSLIVFLSIRLFFSSLKRDIKMKMIWLHHPDSIVLLIFVKFIYQMIAMHMLLGFALLGLFFLDSKIDGTFFQISVLWLYLQLVCNLIYVFFSVLLLFLNAITLQLKQFIGKFSYVISIILGLAFFLSSERWSFKILKIGKLPTEKIIPYFPTFSDKVTIQAMNFYVVQEIVLFIFFAGLFIIACKWIERVITQ